MRYETKTTTTAEPSRLWAVVSDVDKWPDWIEAYEEVRRAGHGPLTAGDSAYVKQKGLAGGDWTVTELDQGRVFAWETRQPGVRIVGRHVVEGGRSGGSRLTLQLEMTGWASGIAALMLGKKVRSYVDLECARLAAVAAERTTA